MFNEKSFLVQLYVKKIKEGTITFEEVPVLYNLKEVIGTLI